MFSIAQPISSHLCLVSLSSHTHFKTGYLVQWLLVAADKKAQCLEQNWLPQNTNRKIIAQSFVFIS